MTEQAGAAPAASTQVPILEAIADLLPATVRTRIDAPAGRLYAERVRVLIAVYVELRAGELYWEWGDPVGADVPGAARKIVHVLGLI